MMDRIEHFILGDAQRLAAFCAALPAGVTVRHVPGGLVLTEAVDPDEAAGIARIGALAREHGLVHDGWGRALDVPEAAAEDVPPINLEAQSFAARTGVMPGHGFALPLGEGRFGHAVFLGEDGRGYLLLRISARVTERPMSADDVAAAPLRYRQPILVWNSGFAVQPLAGASVPLVTLPVQVAFRAATGWPDPEAVAGLGRRFGIANPDSRQGWESLVRAMAQAGQILPGIEGHSIWTAKVARSGKLRLIEDYSPVCIEDRDHAPMPWQPARMDEVLVALGGGVDMVAARDVVM